MRRTPPRPGRPGGPRPGSGNRPARPPKSGPGQPSRASEAPSGGARSTGPAKPGPRNPSRHFEAPQRAPKPPEQDEHAPRAGAGAGSGAYWLYGLHAVAAALQNPRRTVRRLLVTADGEAALLAALGGPPPRLRPERAERARFHTFLPEDSVHQGVALLLEPLQPTPLEDAIAASHGPVLLLDQVTDVRNVGAILRSAAAFGAAAVVMQDRHAPQETGALARAASGMLERVPVVREVNIARTIQQLQRQGFWVLGLVGEATRTLAQALHGIGERRVALVLGAEDAGLRRLQREACDELVRLPMADGVESLNVAAATAVALYELVRE